MWESKRRTWTGTSNSTPAPPSASSKAPLSPKNWLAPAPRFGMPAMALVDRNGVYGAPRFHMAAKKAGIRAHIGAEITCTDGLPLSAAGRNARGLPESLPPGHPHEAARQERRRRGHPRKRSPNSRAGLICLAACVRSSKLPLLDIFGHAESLRRTAAPSTIAKKRRATRR